LEKYLGYDAALYLTAQYLWLLHGHRTPLSGILPHWDYWPWVPRRRAYQDRLPPFKLNCFIQAKRCGIGKRLPKRLAALGSKRPFYRFEIDEEQQGVLEATARILSDRALFIYAAPVFGTTQALFSHMTDGTIVEQSTFPNVLTLATHKAWYYNEPGAAGVPNPDYERVELPTLSERLDRLLREHGNQQTSSSEELVMLSSTINKAVLSDIPVTVSGRRAHLAEDWRRIARYAEQVELPRAATAFLEIDAFARRFNLEWFVVGTRAA